MAKTGTKKSKTVKSGKGVANVGDYSVLLSPVITEKASMLGGEKRNIVFRVRIDASKPEIKEAVEHVFNVQVQSVRTCNTIGKIKRTARSTGRRPGSKKAYVTLKPGHTIDIVEGV